MTFNAKEFATKWLQSGDANHIASLAQAAYDLDRAELVQERDKLKEGLSAIQKTFKNTVEMSVLDRKQLMGQLQDRDSALAKANEILRDYGRHTDGCNYPHGKEYGCKCGWLEALRTTEAAKEKG